MKFINEFKLSKVEEWEVPLEIRIGQFSKESPNGDLIKKLFSAVDGESLKEKTLHFLKTEESRRDPAVEEQLGKIIAFSSNLTRSDKFQIASELRIALPMMMVV